MFSRVLTRNFFFRRGQHADSSAKQNKATPRSRSASPERRETKNILQPSSQNVVAGDSAQADTPQVDNAELVSKPSVQSVNGQVDEHDENSPARFQPYVDPESRTETSLGDVDQSLVFQGCDHSLTPSVQDTTTSFILVNTSNDAVKPLELDDESDDGEEQTFETPQLGSSQSEEDMSLDPVVDVVHQAVETPNPGSSASVEALFPEPDAITVRLPPPIVLAEQVDIGPEAVNFLILDCTPSVSADDLSLELEQTSLDMEPLSLPTGLLSDITEEPSLSELSCRSPADGSESLEVPADAPKADLSFASFGSSYAHSHSADTFVVLPSEPRSTPSTPTRFQEVMQNILAEAVASRSPNWGDVDVSKSLVLPPPTITPSLSAPATSGAVDRACSPVVDSLASCAFDSEDLPPPSGSQLSISSLGLVQQNDTITASVGVEATVKLPDIPTPTTYADAMNLALQYPEMSARLLQEPLASPSGCPTPARSASPARSAAASPPKKAADVAPGRAAAASASGKSKKNKGAAHSKERPNWARAIEDLKADLQQRPRGRSIAVASTRAHDEPRNGQPGNREPIVDAQPPADASRPLQPSTQAAPINPRSRQPSPVKQAVSTEPFPSDASPGKPSLPGKADSQPQSPEKRPVGLSKRYLKGERVAVWLPRVHSWVQQTSSVDQTSPSAHNTPAGSLETSPAMAPAESSAPEVQPAPITQARPSSGPKEQPVAKDVPAPSDAKSPTVPRATPTTSPLNPLAPIWEFKPHQRAATATFPQQPPHGAPFMNSSAPPGSHGPFPHGIEADLERLRVMLHNSGLEDRRLSAAQPHQPRSIWGSPEHAQAAAHTNTVPHNIIVPMNSRHNFHAPPAPRTNLAAPPGNAGRQRTQTHIPLSQQASWQGVPSRPGLTAPEQLASARGAPGFVSTANLPPPVPYLSMTMSGLSPLSQMASRAALDAQPIGPRPPGAPHNAPAPLPPASRTRSGSVSLPMSQAVQFANAGRHPSRSPGETYYSSSPPAPPGSGRPWPPANAPAAVPNTRFYGIETPLVVFDKHGWTVNNK